MNKVRCTHCKSEMQYMNSGRYGVCPCCGEKVVLENANDDHQTYKTKNSNATAFFITAVVLASTVMFFIMTLGIIAVSGESNEVKAEGISSIINLLRTDVATVAYAGNDLQALPVIDGDFNEVSAPTPTDESMLSAIGEAALASPTPTPTSKPTTTPTPPPTKNRITKITISNDGDFETFLGGDAIHGVATVVKTDPKAYSVTDISFISSNPKVATIKGLTQKNNTELGFVIEPVSVGETYIYAKTANGYISSNQVKVKVLDPVEAESISLNYDEYSANVGECFYLSADLSPEETSIKKVTWSSSDSSVAFVASSGTVRALKAGEAEITATTSNGLSATCYVYVEDESSDDGDYYEEDYYEDYSNEEYVWLSATGSKYHNKPDCGNMNPNNAYQVTISYAEDNGYDPCKKCY
ncbi:MAG: Ig-like domain-containing protein [Eubacteriales bacterium]|nr:Ig-like domain-containing protein [Eubacteriales bacterium]